MALLFALPGSSEAQPRLSSDPTRPASQWLASQAPTSGVQGELDGAQPPGVQITVIGTARRFAVVDGHKVQVGEIHQGAKLVSVDSHSVWLKNGGARVELQITPNVRKKILVPNPVLANKVMNGESP